MYKTSIPFFSIAAALLLFSDRTRQFPFSPSNINGYTKVTMKSACSILEQLTKIIHTISHNLTLYKEICLNWWPLLLVTARIGWWTFFKRALLCSTAKLHRRNNYNLQQTFPSDNENCHKFYKKYKRCIHFILACLHFNYYLRLFTMIWGSNCFGEWLKTCRWFVVIIVCTKTTTHSIYNLAAVWN